VSESNIELSRRWTRSVESESLIELSELASAAADGVYETWLAETLESELQPHASMFSTDEDWPDIARQIVSRPYYKQAAAPEQRRIDAVLFGDPRWIYTKELSTDGLWDEVIPTRTAPLNTMSRIVLSGALGDALVKQDIALATKAEQFTNDSFQQAVLLGGAAVYSFQAAHHRPTLQGFYRANDTSGLLRWETAIGGDIHGDFRTERRARPIASVADTTHPEATHHFMPAIYETKAGAYHSTEQGIISALLYHLVTHGDRTRTEVYGSITSALSARDIAVGGNFADYGDRGGEVEAALLRNRLDTVKDKPSGMIYESVVDANVSARFHIESRDDGVVFRVSEAGEPDSEMHIPTQEIELYILTMVSAGGGRTSPDAMAQVIGALNTSAVQ